MTGKMKFAAPCIFGLESVLAFEVRRTGAENVNVSDGRVTFEGNEEILARANLTLSTAERVMIELGSFRAESFEELFNGVRALPLEEFIGRDDAFPVKGHSINSKLHSIPDCQKIIKKAAATRLGRAYGLNTLPETGGISGIASVTSLASSDAAAIEGIVSLLRRHGSR